MAGMANDDVNLLKWRKETGETAFDNGTLFAAKSNSVDNARLIDVNEEIRNHPVEVIGKKLRGYISDMQKIVG